MKQTAKTRSSRSLVLPTLAEDAVIVKASPKTQKAASQTPMNLARCVEPPRPLGSGTKSQITLRLEELGVDERMTAVAAYAGYCSL